MVPKKRRNPPPPPELVVAQLEKARTGENDDLGILLALYWSYLVVIAREELNPKVKPKGGPSDLVQDAFVIAHRRFPEFRGTSAPQVQVWLRKILLNVIDDWHRRFLSAKKRSVTLEQSLDGADSREIHSTLAVCDSSPPGSCLNRQDETRLVKAAMAKMADVYRTVMQWHYFEGQSHQDIAQRLDRTPEAVKMLIFRATTQLSKEMYRHGNSD